MAVIDRVSGTETDTLLAIVQEAGDQELAWFGSESFGLGGFITPSSGVTVLRGSLTEQFMGRPHLGLRRIRVNLQGNGSSTVTARVRLWAASRGGSRRYHHLLLKQRIQGTAPVYTPEAPGECLLEVDKVVPCVLTEDVSGSPLLDVQAEESPNGRVWKNVQGSPEIAGIAITSGGVFVASFGSLSPSSARVRYRVQLSGTNPAATVRLWVTGRDVFPR
jgi:hypothetical protein